MTSVLREPAQPVQDKRTDRSIVCPYCESYLGEALSRLTVLTCWKCHAVLKASYSAGRKVTAEAHLTEIVE